MNEILKTIKKMKENELDNLSSLLVAMKKNCELKQNMENLFFDESTLPEDLKAYCDIMGNNPEWIENYNLHLYKNLISAIEKYNTQAEQLKKSINAIETIMLERFQSEIAALFSTDALIEDDSNLVCLIIIDSFMKKASLVLNDNSIDYNDYLHNEGRLIKALTKKYALIKEMIEMKLNI